MPEPRYIPTRLFWMIVTIHGALMAFFLTFVVTMSGDLRSTSTAVVNIEATLSRTLDRIEKLDDRQWAIREGKLVQVPTLDEGGK